jgi:hypothetical protein
VSAQKFEAFLAKLYVDDQARARFVVDPRREGLKAGLREDECAALEKIDMPGLELAAASFARKRASHGPRESRLNRNSRSARGRLINLLGSLAERITMR